jgi:hypothetical protein
MFSWIVKNAKESPKLKTILNASPLVKSFKEIARYYAKSDMNFFQFQILNNSKFDEDIESFDYLIDDFDKIKKQKKLMEKSSEKIIKVLSNIEKIMAFETFNNYTAINDVKDDFDNLPKTMQKIKITKFNFANTLEDINKYGECILLIESRIFQKSFIINLAKLKYTNIITKMYGSIEEEQNTRGVQKDELKTLEFLNKIIEKSNAEPPENQTELLSLKDFWTIMEMSTLNYQDLFKFLNKKSKEEILIDEIKFIMEGLIIDSEQKINLNSKIVPQDLMNKAFENYFLVINLINMSDYLQTFLNILEFDFTNKLKELHNLTKKAKEKDVNFYDVLALALNQDPKIQDFCKSNSVIYKFIELNVTVWKGNICLGI